MSNQSTLFRLFTSDCAYNADELQKSLKEMFLYTISQPCDMGISERQKLVEHYRSMESILKDFKEKLEIKPPLI